jgi:hypothetical protein
MAEADFDARTDDPLAPVGTPTGVEQDAEGPVGTTDPVAGTASSGHLTESVPASAAEPEPGVELDGDGGPAGSERSDAVEVARDAAAHEDGAGIGTVSATSPFAAPRANMSPKVVTGGALDNSGTTVLAPVGEPDRATDSYLDGGPLGEVAVSDGSLDGTHQRSAAGSSDLPDPAPVVPPAPAPAPAPVAVADPAPVVPPAPAPAPVAFADPAPVVPPAPAPAPVAVAEPAPVAAGGLDVPEVLDPSPPRSNSKPLAALPDPVNGMAPVYVVGMVKRCYSCGEPTRVISGVLINAPDVPDDDTNSVRKRRKVNVDRTPKFRYVTFQTVVDALIQTLDADWYRRYQVGPIEERQMDEEYQWTGDVSGVSNGCVHCDAMLRDYPIQDAFEEAIGTHREYSSFAFATIELPVSVLPEIYLTSSGESALAPR